jgi:hypothetical protein
MDTAARLMAVKQAVTDKRLRLQLDGTLPQGLDVWRVWAEAWQVVLARHGGPTRVSQDALLELVDSQAEPGGFVVTLRYLFDADFASQYDATQTYDLVLGLGAAGVEVRMWRTVK